MNYTKKSFSVAAPNTDAYRAEWERIFRPSAAPRSCNRHDDCDAAEITAFGKLGYVPNFHCHDEDCEECFGK